MRTSLRLVLLFSLLGACGTTPAISVIRNERVAQPKGDPVKIRRGTQEAFANVKGGYFVVRTHEDWNALWPEGKAPELPPTLDTSRSMLLLAIGESKDTVALQVRKVIDVGEYLHVLVHEGKPGEGCVAKIERPAFDAVIVDRIDKPVKFFVDEERGEGCGQAPETQVTCRVGDTAQWTTAVKAQPGETVECMMTAAARGRFEVTDTVIHLAELPGGSSAKLSYPKGPARGSFTVDVFGKYSVRGEATDEAGRKTTQIATIDALPPKSNDVIVQLVWNNFDVSDDPETFPRVKLAAIPEEGPKRRTCTAETPIPGVCEVKTKSGYTHMKIISGIGAKKMPLSVAYTDERVEKGPMVCVQVYVSGDRASETCDRAHRDANDVWELGILDVATGKITEPPPKPASSADAGAPPAKPPPRNK
jgi:hypothetical protein